MRRKRGQLKLGFDVTLQIIMPQTALNLLAFCSFSMCNLGYERSTLLKIFFCTTTLQTNITQNVNLFTTHVINIFKKTIYITSCEHLDESKIYKSFDCLQC